MERSSYERSTQYPTISFRISPRERDEIEAKIKASGMQKKDYFVTFLHL